MASSSSAVHVSRERFTVSLVEKISGTGGCVCSDDFFDAVLQQVEIMTIKAADARANCALELRFEGIVRLLKTAGPDFNNTVLYD